MKINEFIKQAFLQIADGAEETNREIIARDYCPHGTFEFEIYINIEESDNGPILRVARTIDEEYAKIKFKLTVTGPEKSTDEIEKNNTSWMSSIFKEK